MSEGAPPVRPVVCRVVEARRPTVIVFLFVVGFVLVLADEDDCPVDVNVVVAVVQRVQPRQDRQRGAEGADHETGRGSRATHSPAV